MRDFVWSDDLLVGHERIDLDFRRLVDLSCEIEDLIAARGGNELLCHKLAEFRGCLAAHCAFEEELMQALPRVTYGQRVDKHSSRHAALIHAAKELADVAGNMTDGWDVRAQESSQALAALLKALILDDRELLGAMVKSNNQGASASSEISASSEKSVAGASQSRPASISMYLILIVVSVLLLMLALLGLTVYETTERVESETRYAARAILGGIASEVTGTLRANKDVMERIALRPLIRQPTQAKCDPILWEFKEIFPRFANATTIELDGTALCSAVPQPGGKPVNVFKAEWFQRVMTQKDFVVGKPFLGPITGRWVSVLVLPVYNELGVHVRYLGFPLDLAALVPSIGRLPLLPDTVVGIAASDGMIVWRSIDTENWVGKSLKDRTAFTNFVEWGISETTTTGIDNISRTYFFERIEESDWVLWIGMPTSIVRSMWLKVLPPAATLGLIGLIVVAAISVLLARRIVKPMSSLADTARAIQKGQLDARARLEGPREVMAVAMEVNAMLDLREKQTEELMRSNVELERFAYVASHDLQEPVRTVVAYSQLLERRYADCFDSDGKEYLNFVIGGARRMGDLVRDLLSYSRVSESGRKYTAIDLAALARDVVESLQALIEQNGAEVMIDEASLPTVQGDRMQLMEVLQNIVINAIRFRKATIPPAIRISARSDAKNIAVCVTDNGIGIERQYWDHIFLVFKRLHGAAYPGTGIGLAICKRIIEGHGGRIWVESKPGEGSSFCFTLPLS